MSELAVKVENITKLYKIYANPRERLLEWFVPFGRKRHEEKWVLKGVSFELKKGEAIGIVGMNGAGKSTLLKIITGTVAATTGSCAFYGKVAALLELGLGFHHDFTGRQNVFISGQLLGYSVAEITEHMQQIEDFAEIGEAIDAPVRTYSSGMQVRLAFSVATMKRPDILIIDEALSVGDSYFQHKSFNRIKEFQEQGTTLLLVSHDKMAIQSVCDRAILLNKGEVIKDGDPHMVMDYYNAMLAEIDGNIKQEISGQGIVRTSSGSHGITTTSLEFLNSKGIDAEVYIVGEVCKLVIKGKANENIPSLVCGFALKDRLGRDIYGINTYYFDQELHDVQKGEEVEFTFTVPLNIGIGNYSITTCFSGGRTHLETNYEWIDLAKVFEVIHGNEPVFIGTSFLDTTVSINKP